MLVAACMLSAGCGAVTRRSSACIASGDYDQCHWAGREFLLEGNYAKAAEMFQRACNAGYAGACINLALLYQARLGKTNREAEARRLLRESCSPFSSGCVTPIDPVDGVTVEWQQRPFTVQGHSTADLRAATERNVINGRPAFASIVTDLEVQLPCQGGRVSEPHVVVRLTLQEPEWIDRPPGESTVSRTWDDWTRRAHLHELGHAAFAIAAANKLMRRLRDWSRDGDCADAARDAVEARELAMVGMGRDHDAFDAAWRHDMWLGDRPEGAARVGGQPTQADQKEAEGNVERVVDAAEGALRECLERHGATGESKPVTATLKLGPNGRPLQVSVAGTSGAPALAPCLEGVLSGLRYGWIPHAPVTIELGLGITGRRLADTMADVRFRIRLSAPTLAACLAKSLAAAPVTVRTHFVIDVNGAVTRAEIDPGSALPEKATALAECVLSVIRRIHFKPGEVVNVSYPFRFRADGPRPK